MRSKLLAAALVAGLGSPALAQYSTTPPPTPPPAYPPSPAPPSAPSTAPQPSAPAQIAPAQTAPAQQAVPAQTAPVQQPSAGTPATSGASQQVVVNPPATAPAPQPAQPAQTAPSSAPAQVTVNPPAQPAPAPSTVVVDRGERRAQTVVVGDETRHRNPMAQVAMSALYGGAAGAVVGVGVALIEGDNWARDVTVGAGLGVLTGAVVGGVMAYGGDDRVAMDGLGTPARDRDKQRRMTPVAGYAFRW